MIKAMRTFVWYTFTHSVVTHKIEDGEIFAIANMHFGRLSGKNLLERMWKWKYYWGQFPVLKKYDFYKRLCRVRTLLDVNGDQPTRSIRTSNARGPRALLALFRGATQCCWTWSGTTPGWPTWPSPPSGSPGLRCHGWAWIPRAAPSLMGARDAGQMQRLANTILVFRVVTYIPEVFPSF